MYIIKQNLVASENYSIKCPYSMTAEFIVVHNTANDATAENEVAYMIGNKNQVSFHYAVDDQEVVQGIPITRNTWHAGDGNGEGNRKGISIEICYSKSGGTRFDQAEKNAAHFIATLLRERGWGIEKVKKHQDFRNKYCPHRTLDKGWNGFLQMIKSYLNDIPVTSSSGYTVGERVRVKESATQYATGQALAWFVKGSIYEVTKVAGDKLLLSDIISWVWIDDVEKVSANTVVATYSSFLVEIICDELNIRQKADFNSKVVGTVKRGEVYTIIQEENGLGKLKSGAGYISLNSKYVKRK
ncbi:N-acetylmuramoyl-L-alanine amidase [Turicibacter bilis]|uniref:N-acetylmuramoyl-L-alanine amidase n=1 Tax=Turicibacter bilis TaxID=2735723 RepID=UPI003F8AD8BD